jgi:hypothetical protein
LLTRKWETVAHYRRGRRPGSRRNPTRRPC